MLGEVYSSVFRVMHLVCDVDLCMVADVSEKLAASFKFVQMSRGHIPEGWNVNQFPYGQC